jgi:hypothetical protein
LAAGSEFFYESGVAANIVGVLLPVLSLVLSPRSINFLLLWVHASKVIRVLRTPVLIALLFSLFAAFLPSTGCLLLLEAWVRNEQAATKRAPPLVRHKDPSPGLQILDKSSTGGGSIGNRAPKNTEPERRGNSGSEEEEEGEE